MQPIVGIEDIAFYVPEAYLPLEALAAARSAAYAKYRDGIGQEEMSLLPPDEDVVTMAAHAALAVVAKQEVRERLQAVIVATESGVDASKATAIFVHGLLGLPAHCAAWDVRQACAGSSAAFIQAAAMVRGCPGSAILVIATDAAAYELGSPAEPTQGAGACAILVSDRPEIAVFNGASYTQVADVNDFWRPPQRTTALVDGRLSVATYLDMLRACRRQMPQAPGMWDRAVFHLPFTRMAAKAAKVLDLPELAWLAGTEYGRRIGNTYTASLFIALSSLLETDPADLSGAAVGMFAYGSGAMGILFELTIQDGYRRHLRSTQHQSMLAARRAVTVDQYETWREAHTPQADRPDPGAVSRMPAFRFAGIRDWQRQYTVSSPIVAPTIDSRKFSG